ncbi:MAG: hypothetical protein RIQ56_734 [Candidatus Parcubacteria bacterium]|jgi:transketolase
MNKIYKKEILTGKNSSLTPSSLQRVRAVAQKVDRMWIGPEDAKQLSKEQLEAYELASGIMKHLCVQAPTLHKSGHPGGPLSAFTFSYCLRARRDYSIDQPMRMSAGHLSLLAYGLDWLFTTTGNDPRLSSPQKIIETFRTPSGLPGHVEAGIGTIPFGFGPLGKGVSNALGAAFGLKFQKKPGIVDVLMADGDSQEGQIMEAFRLASHLKIDNLIVHGDWNDIQLSGMPSKTMASDMAAIAEACGWRVIEVHNGNDVAQVNAALDRAESFVGKGHPIFVCYYTTMGHGIAVMEEGSNTGAVNYHGSPLKDDVAAEVLKKLPPLDELVKNYERYRSKIAVKPLRQAEAIPAPAKIVRTITKEKGAARQDFGAVHIKNLMKADSRILVLHADLAGSGGFDKVQKEFPERVINVGVAEANMVMMAAGMRQVGLLPVTYTFAAFGTNEARASARLIDINCGHTHCAVLNDCTHAGLSVGEDGETHQERNYLNIPFDHTQVWMPADSNQAGAAAERAFELISEGTTNVFTFFPRSGHEQLQTPKGEIIYSSDYVFDGNIDLVRGNGDTTDRVTILATGIPVHDAVRAADELGSRKQPLTIRVLNVACIRPIDASSIIQAALETTHLIVIEDHHSEGGLASQVADIIADFQLPCSLRRLGANQYFPSATDKDLKLMAGLDVESIIDAVEDEIRSEVCGGEDAFVTAIFALEERGDQSRFRRSVRAFIDRLVSEKGYLESLRELWRRRSCPAAKLPKNDDLRTRLRSFM